MKTLVKSAFVIAVVSLFSVSLSAAETVAVQDTVVKDTVEKGIPDGVVYIAADEVTYTKIEVGEIPQAVKTAVADKYSAYTTDEAYKGSDNTYKLILKKDESKLTVYYSESGEFKKEETAGKTQRI